MSFRRKTDDSRRRHFTNAILIILLQSEIALPWQNLGADFGVIGNEPVASNAEGSAYGIEFLAQQRLFNNFYGIAAVTLVRSEFTNPNTEGFIPSSWDNKFIVSFDCRKAFLEITGKLERDGDFWEVLLTHLSIQKNPL